jgi:hypothetical protein
MYDGEKEAPTKRKRTKKKRKKKKEFDESINYPHHQHLQHHHRDALWS